MTFPVSVPGHPPVPLNGTTPSKADGAADKLWVRRIAEKVNDLLRGRINVVLPVTLVANAATTTLTDARISAYSAILWTPLTAHSAAEIAAGGFYVSAQQQGQATLTHANNAQSDREFWLTIIG